MIITDIVAQRRRPTRVSVHMDEQFWIGLEGTLADELGLRIGLSLDEKRRSQIERRIGEYEALDRAVQYLGYRMRTESEVRTKFSDEYPDSILEFVVDKLRGYGYLNDETWMEELVRSAQELGKGRRWVEQKAWQAGVDKRLVANALESYETEDQLEVALEYCRRQGLTAEDSGKLWRRLASRGYTPDVIGRVRDRLKRSDDEYWD